MGGRAIIRDLEEIKGIGEKSKESLIRCFGSQENAIEALVNTDCHALVACEGISMAKMGEILRDAYSGRKGFKYSDILSSRDTRRIYQEIMDTIRSFASTDSGRLELGLFFPTSDIDEFNTRQEIFSKGLSLVEKLPPEDLKEIKSNLKILEALVSKPKNNIQGSVLASEGSLADELEKKYSKTIEVFKVEGLEDLELLKGYDMVRYVISPDEKYSLHIQSLSNVVWFPNFKEEEVIPEMVMDYYFSNKKRIVAAFRILDILLAKGLQGQIPGELINPEEFQEVVNRLDSIKDGRFDWGSRKGIDFSFARDNLIDAANSCLLDANEALKNQINEKSLSLSGGEILNMVSRMNVENVSDISAFLPREIVSLIENVAEEYEMKTAQRLGLGSESIMFSGLLSDELSYPFHQSQEKIEEVQNWIAKEAINREFEMKRELSRSLVKYMDSLNRTISSIIKLDLYIALGDFGKTFNARLPVISGRFGIGFLEGRNLQVQKQLENPQPVDYCLGETEFNLPGSANECISIITGANSGGKTTLLETMAQVQIMGQSGLPVLALEAQFPLLDNLYYFSKNSGDKSAGAFESLLKSMAVIDNGHGKKLILADEIEAVTEPGAAAKIISGLLKWFSRDNNTLVALVTHLGEEIQDVLPPGTRIDGLDAKGLDENLNLIIDRNPKLGKLAKSTPELIVEKLSKKEKGEFYKYMLEGFLQ